MIRTAAMVLWTAITLLAQSGTAPAGHWKGALQVPNGGPDVEIDLAQDAGKGWIGTISIPAQNTKGMPLTEVAVKGNDISFSINAPGDPRFTAKIAKGGTMDGELAQSGGKVPFQLTRTGEAVIEKPVANPPLSKELEGAWDGALNAGGTQLRLRFLLSNKSGAGTGTMVSLDQGNVEIPLARITQTGSKVSLEVPVVSGGFEGDLKGSEITGTWSQNRQSFPLSISKTAKTN